MSAGGTEATLTRLPSLTLRRFDVKLMDLTGIDGVAPAYVGGIWSISSFIVYEQ